MKLELKVTGMTCGGCERSVEAVLRDGFPGIEVKASHIKGIVHIQSENNVKVKDVLDAIRSKGYNVISWENSAN